MDWIWISSSYATETVNKNEGMTQERREQHMNVQREKVI